MSAPAVIVIGAGPAGLAAAAALGREGIPASVLEQADSAAASWLGRYDRLRLNTCRWTSQLPHSRYPARTALFPSRDEVISYLKDYAQRQALEIRVGTRVERIDRRDGGWQLHTPAGPAAARQVIVATGHDHTRTCPHGPGASVTTAACCTPPATATRSRSSAPESSLPGPAAPGWRSPTTSPKAAPAACGSQCAPSRT